MHGAFIGTGEEPVGKLWIKRRQQTRKDNVVCYRPPDQEEKVGEAFSRAGGESLTITGLGIHMLL